MNLPGPNSIPNGLAEHLTDKYVPRSRSLVNRPVPNAKNKMAAINERLYQSSSQDQQLQIQGPSDGTIEQNGMMYETDIKANGELIPYQISSSGRWKGKGKATTSQAQPSAVKGRAGRKPASSSSSEPKGKSSILSNPGPSSMSSKPYRRGKWKGLGKGWRKGMGGPPLTAKPLSQGGILPTHPSDKKRQYKKTSRLSAGIGGGSQAVGETSQINKSPSKSPRRRSAQDYDVQVIIPSPSAPSLKRKSSGYGASSSMKKSNSSSGLTSSSHLSPTVIPHPTYQTSKLTARQLASKNRQSVGATSPSASTPGPSVDMSSSNAVGEGTKESS